MIGFHCSFCCRSVSFHLNATGVQRKRFRTTKFTILRDASQDGIYYQNSFGYLDLSRYDIVFDYYIAIIFNYNFCRDAVPLSYRKLVTR